MGIRSILQHITVAPRVARMRAAAWGAAFAITLGLVAGHARAAPVTSIGSPLYEWVWEEVRSNGQGGTLSERFAVGPFFQVGGELDQGYQLPPPPPLSSTLTHLKVFANSTATTFWTEAVGPGTGLFPPLDVAVGGNARLGIYQTFRKDEADATLSFTISALTIRAFALGVPGTEGLTGVLGFTVNVYDNTSGVPLDVLPVLDQFTHVTSLTGTRGDWTIENLGPLNVDFIDGTSETTTGASVALLAPFTRGLNLSQVPVGEEFLLVYQMFATAIDTEQADSRIQAFGRDPLTPGSGTSFSFTGLTPTNQGFVPGAATAVPEPASLVLFALGGLGLVAMGAMRRHWRHRKGKRCQEPLAAIAWLQHHSQ